MRYKNRMFCVLLISKKHLNPYLLVYHSYERRKQGKNNLRSKIAVCRYFCKWKFLTSMKRHDGYRIGAVLQNVVVGLDFWWLYNIHYENVLYQSYYWGGDPFRIGANGF